MHMTELDHMISEVVRRMIGMSNEEISDYLYKCKGISVSPDWVQMYRPVTSSQRNG